MIGALSVFAPFTVETQMKVAPYLSLDGRCEEALEFYRSALGAETQAIPS